MECMILGGGIDTSYATATAASILRGFSAYVDGEKIDGQAEAKDPNVVRGSLTVASETTSGSIQIATVEELGFTPTVAAFWAADIQSNARNKLAFASFYNRGRASLHTRVAGTGVNPATAYDVSMSTYLSVKNGALVLQPSSAGFLDAGVYEWVAIR